MIGVVVFSGLYIFFDEYGSQLFVYALLAIGFLYLTGWSYVEMGSRIKRTLSLISRKWWATMEGNLAEAQRKKQQRQLHADVEDEDDEDDQVVVQYPILNVIDEENHQPAEA